MSENANTDAPETMREPDNIIKSRRDGTTYIIREYMVGKEPAADIVVRRIMRKMEPNFPMTKTR